MKDLFINKPINLLQEVRLIHSLYDSGYNIWLDDTNFQKLTPIFKNFNGVAKIGINKSFSNFTELVKIEHNKPLTSFNGVVKPLFFPKSLITFCQNNTLLKSFDKILFIGLLINKRENVIKKLIDLKIKDVIVKNTLNGRKFPQKSFDKNYFIEMCKYNFIFCPNGDFVWTYRFFESIMCNAIPIVENDCELYENFKYYNINNSDNIIYKKDWVSFNLKRLIDNFTL